MIHSPSFGWAWKKSLWGGNNYKGWDDDLGPFIHKKKYYRHTLIGMSVSVTTNVISN